MYAVSIPITDFILNFMLQMIMETIGFKLIADVTVFNVFIGFVTIHIVFGITSYYITKYYDSIQISDIIKHNIK